MYGEVGVVAGGCDYTAGLSVIEIRQQGCSLNSGWWMLILWLFYEGPWPSIGSGLHCL